MPILWFSVLRNSSTVVEPSKPTTYTRKQIATISYGCRTTAPDVSDPAVLDLEPSYVKEER